MSRISSLVGKIVPFLMYHGAIHVGSCNGWDLLFDVKIRLCAATPIIKFLAPLSLLIQPQTGFRFLCHFTRVARVHCTLVFILFVGL